MTAPSPRLPGRPPGGKEGRPTCCNEGRRENLRGLLVPSAGRPLGMPRVTWGRGSPASILPARKASDPARRRCGPARHHQAGSARGGQETKNDKGEAHRGTRGHSQGAAGGRCPLRPPDAPLEPQDAPLHLRRARRDPHHRFAADRAHAAQRPGIRGRARRSRGHRPVRGDEEAGARHDRGSRQERGDALCPSALAGRPP